MRQFKYTFFPFCTFFDQQGNLNTLFTNNLKPFTYDAVFLPFTKYYVHLPVRQFNCPPLQNIYFPGPRR